MSKLLVCRSLDRLYFDVTILVMQNHDLDDDLHHSIKSKLAS